MTGKKTFTLASFCQIGYDTGKIVLRSIEKINANLGPFNSGVSMVVRIVKVIVGIGLAINIAAEYQKMRLQTGNTNILSLAFICLIGAFCLLLAYSGIKNKPLLSFLKKKN